MSANWIPVICAGLPKLGAEGAGSDVEVGVEVAGVAGVDIAASDGVDEPPPPPLVAVPLRVNTLDGAVPPG